jgi:hypothetical protein
LHKRQRNLVNNKKKQAKEKFYANVNDNLSDLKSVNSKLYYKTINMLLKSERPTNDVPPISGPTALLGSKIFRTSITSCSLTTIVVKVLQPLSSKSGRSIPSSSKSVIEQKYEKFS